MTDALWRERLAELAEEDDATSFLVEDDLARGRERLRRRRVGELGAAVLVVAVLAGTLLLSGGQEQRATDPPVTTVPTTPTSPVPPVVESAVTPPSPPSSTAAPYGWIQRVIDTSDGPRSPFPRWRNRLFATTGAVLDPSGGHLNYSSQGLVGGYDDHGVSVGIKMGWQEPGRSGEAMVQVEVGSRGGSDNERCELTGGFGCPTEVRIGGRVGHVGEAGSAYVVTYPQADGDRVTVLVDTLFGNTSRTPVRSLGFTRGDVYRLVQDDRLDLPHR